MKEDPWASGWEGTTFDLKVVELNNSAEAEGS